MGEGGGDGDGGDGHGYEAGVGEPEFLEEDHGTGIGDDFQVFDLGGGGGEEGEKEEEHGGDGQGCFRHFRVVGRRVLFGKVFSWRFKGIVGCLRCV